MTALPCTACGCIIDGSPTLCPECGIEDPAAEYEPCSNCDGEGSHETLDHAAIHPCSLSPPYKTAICRACRGTGSIERPCVLERAAAEGDETAGEALRRRRERRHRTCPPPAAAT